jgi:membrane protein DedA with SNARE-associated domain
MSPDTVTNLIIEYRYWILIPLSIMEGPIVAFAAGTLASLGYFNIFVLAGFFFVRDMVMDGLYYVVGYYGGRTRFVQNMLKRVGVEAGHLEDIRKLWEKHAGKTMFLGKLSYGIASGFIAVAGMVKMPLRKFFGYGAIVAVSQYGVLLALGYFYGNSLGGNAGRIIDNIQYLLVGVIALGSIYFVVSRYARSKLKEEK